ncbi:MAG: hypothetical protein ACYS3N_18850 [Planctomycetota bacterium]
MNIPRSSLQYKMSKLDSTIP